MDFHNNTDPQSVALEQSIIKPVVNYLIEIQSSDETIEASETLYTQKFYNVDEIPEGGYFMNFPASEYLVVTHEWVYKTDEAFPLIGITVGYAHSEEAHIKIPDRYERDNDNLFFIEHYNYKYEENEYRLEIWFAIRKTN